MITMCSL